MEEPVKEALPGKARKRQKQPEKWKANLAKKQRLVPTSDVMQFISFHLFSTKGTQRSTKLSQSYNGWLMSK